MSPRRRLKPWVRHTLWGLLVVLIALLAWRVVACRHHAGATPPAPQSTKRPSATAVQATIKRRWRRILDATDAPATVAIESRRYHLTVTATNQPRATFTTASIVKVAIVAALYHQHQVAGTAVTAAEQTAAKAAIEQSDNAAASQLYAAIHTTTGLTALFQALHMTHSQASPVGWTQTVTTAADQLKLLAAIFTADSDYLTATARKQLRTMMGNVASDQAWGVAAGSTTYQLKNGWRENYRTNWVVNSIGHIGKGKDAATIAVLTTDNRSFKAGRQLVAQLTKAAANALKIAN